MKTEAQIKEILREACENAGSQKAFALKHEMSQGYVCDVLKGNRGLGESILNALGYKELEARYVLKKPSKKQP